MRQCGNASRYARDCRIMSLFCQNCHPISLVNRKFDTVWENLSLRERLEPILDLCHYLCHTSYYFLHIIDKNQPKVSQAKQICFESGIILCIFNMRTKIAPLPDCEGTLPGLIYERSPVLNGFASSAFWVWSLVHQSLHPLAWKLKQIPTAIVQCRSHPMLCTLTLPPWLPPFLFLWIHSYHPKI